MSAQPTTRVRVVAAIAALALAVAAGAPPLASAGSLARPAPHSGQTHI